MEEATAGEVTDEDVQEEDFHYLYLNEYKAYKVSVDQVETGRKNGTVVSDISRETYDKYFKHLDLEPVNVNINVYDGSL